MKYVRAFPDDNRTNKDVSIGTSHEKDYRRPNEHL